MTAMVHHRLEDPDPSPDGVATCTCGWRSLPASTVAQVERRWDVHVAERRSAAWIERAVAMQVEACRRTVRLVQLGQGLRARRREIRRQRMQVRAALERVRLLDRGIVSPPLAGELLEQARRDAGCPVEDLWWAYVELGGSRPPSDLVSMLAGDEPVDPPDEALLRVALRERAVTAPIGDAPWSAARREGGSHG